MDFYKQIFKRKSFHLFRERERLTADDIAKLKAFLGAVQPLYPQIRTEILILPESETTCSRGGEYSILFYSEARGDYLRNIGYMGEQIDLYLAGENIGALWFGIGRPKEMQRNGLSFVIMLTIGKMPENKFRKDMFKAKRKPIEEIWSGDTLGVGEIVRFAPSACNTQPWITENSGGELLVYRYKKPGKRGIMPADKVSFYNRIDMGIYLFILEVCLSHENILYERELFSENEEAEKTLTAKYNLLQ